MNFSCSPNLILAAPSEPLLLYILAASLNFNPWGGSCVFHLLDKNICCYHQLHLAQEENNSDFTKVTHTGALLTVSNRRATYGSFVFSVTELFHSMDLSTSHYTKKSP